MSASPGFGWDGGHRLLFFDLCLPDDVGPFVLGRRGDNEIRSDATATPVTVIACTSFVLDR